MASKMIHGNSRAVNCILEYAFRHTFGKVFELVKDGGSTGSLMYTRVYRLKLDGAYLNTWVRFIYDLREGYGGVEFNYKSLEDIEALVGSGRVDSENTTIKAFLDFKKRAEAAQSQEVVV